MKRKYRPPELNHSLWWSSPSEPVGNEPDLDFDTGLIDVCERWDEGEPLNTKPMVLPRK